MRLSQISAFWLSILATLSTSVTFVEAQPQPDEWWLKAKGTKITSYNDFRKLIIPRQDLGNLLDANDNEAGSLANTHIIMEFYMEWCHFCKEFVSNWNAIVDQMEQKYNVGGQKKIAFLMVDGTKQNELRRRYKVQGFPQFVYLKPGSKAKVAKSFEEQRTMENMIEWIEQNVQKYENAGSQGDHHEEPDGNAAAAAQARLHQQQFAQDFKVKQEEIKKMSLQQVEQELMKMSNEFNQATTFLSQHLNSLDHDLSSHMDKSKLFEEEYLLKQKRIGELYKQFKDEFLKSQMFKDAAMFLIGFVGGLIVTVVFIIVSMPAAQGSTVQKKVEQIHALDEEDSPKIYSKGNEAYLASSVVNKDTDAREETGASSGMQMYSQDDFIDEESSDSVGSARLSQRQPHSHRKKQ